ncbi:MULTISPECIES: RHS repeat-associated core domain-containing protein [unclassified Pseudomonas]|nr:MULTISPECIES: RHS repeat-associated core domain-containing protein [unclassified Pseudomonas]PMZ86016.1 hypothetical protein C1X61_24775 [Pseudomonas sp. FW215-T2]PNA10186.1 hypothetical protein C1X62_18760 [Pseudomonas sp. FW215-R3]PNB36217.1 hypothetical protein C1X63_18380 [Pseudomonas sp. FW305-131]
MLSPHKTVLCQYRYDALDQLIESSPQQAPQLQRFYCKSRLATEIQGTTQHSIIQHGDLLLAQQQREGNERNAHLLATDQQRSVLRTLNANSHSKPITYSPYGHRHPENGWLSLLGFNGERPDPVTGHYLLGNGYRAFNPVLMRFNSSDSWSPFGDGGLNAYAYCAGDPINKYDPSGHMFGKIIPRKVSTGIVEYVMNGTKLKRHAHITLNQARSAANQINQTTKKLKNLNISISATLETDFKLRESSSIIELPSLNLEMLARDKMNSSLLSMDSLPSKLRNHHPNHPYPHQQRKMSPNQLSDQINLMEYINGDSTSSKIEKILRLNKAANHQEYFIKNGIETPLNKDLAQKYLRKLHVLKYKKRKPKEIRAEIFNSHFHY